MEEEDQIVLPDNLFINLLDTELQEQILNGKELDLDVKNAIETLIEEGPTSLKNDLTYQKIWNFDGTLWRCTMITKWQDTQESWKLTMELSKTTGGQDYGRL
jgi:hypothetical protein